MQTGKWALVERLLGRWEGEARGKPGLGSQTRNYELILGGTFIMGTNRTLWQPTSIDESGEIHEDMGVWSFDQAADEVVLRAFFSENLACDYRSESGDSSTERLVMRADTVENGGSIRARETFEFRGLNELVSTFEIGSSEGSFEIYTVEHLKRALSD